MPLFEGINLRKFDGLSPINSLALSVSQDRFDGPSITVVGGNDYVVKPLIGTAVVALDPNTSGYDVDGYGRVMSYELVFNSTSVQPGTIKFEIIDKITGDKASLSVNVVI